MKKIRLLLALFAAGIGSVQGAWAERVAPTFPEAQTLESGQTYYLYNVGSGKFAYRDSNNDAHASETSKTGVIITAQDNGYYTLQFSDNNYYWYMSSTSSTPMYSGSSLLTSYCYFRIAETEGGYTIQRNYSYDETKFVGVSSDYIYANLETGNLVWQLFDAEGAEAVIHYKAKKALYDALETAEVNYAWAIADFEAIYENEASTTAELNAAATALNKRLSISNGYQAPWWNERPIVFYTADGSFGQNNHNTWALPNNSYTSGTYFYRYKSGGQSSSISATVLVEEPSTLVYATDATYYYGGSGNMTVAVDGVQVRTLAGSQLKANGDNYIRPRFFEELEPGLHTITWTWTCNGGSSDFYLHNVSVMAKPQITVSLLEPGSLGTEVLYNTDHVKNVRRLKVKGAMNSDDWARIKMMSTLLELDLSEAQFTEIPAKQFYVSSSDTTMNFLHKVVLPEGLTTIGDQAFNDSFVEDINLPSTMKRVGKRAFWRSHVKELIMPDDMTDFYGGSNEGCCFEYMYWLKKLVLPKNLTRIPYQTFRYCYYITEAMMPEKLQTVGGYAFASCSRMQTTLPEGLKTIESYGFAYCNALNTPLPSTLTSIGSYAFQNCTSLTKVELNVNLYSLANGVFQDCSKLDTLKLNSPTVITMNNSSSSYYPLSDISKLVLQVPHYLVNSYKLHSYWYNAKSIEPFDYSSIDRIHLRDNLTLNHERFGGQPSIDIYGGCYLKINGDSEQKFKNIAVNNNPSGPYYGQLLNNCDNVTANGYNTLYYYTEAKKWYFISLPFDLDVSRITPETSGVQYAIRYYDGAGRAANGKSGNWQNVDRTGIIPAGTGFIFQTNIATWTDFYAADTENKYGTLRTTEFNKTLDVNASETASDRGWNLVGNPYQCFYNNHCLNFTAPITVWTGSTYTAYSLTDDDYAICPNEAFFVQCPNEEYTTLGFPLQGRQLTSVIESQNAARTFAPRAGERKLIDVELSDGELSDKTRFVLNPKAEMGYEVSRDASKFMSMDAGVPQIYTIENGEPLAINERPLGECTVQIGIVIPRDGTYTITAPRNQFQDIVLVDNETGTETLLADGASYTFTASAGTYESCFVLRVGGTMVTDVQSVAVSQQQTGQAYNLQGQRIAAPQRGIYIVNGKKTVIK